MAQQIGQFTIVAELAKTEGGAVYKATDPKGRTVALRTLRLDAPGAAEAVPGVRAAAKAASTLASPNIASLFGGGEAAGVFFIAVEFVEGVKLSSTLAKGEPVSMSEVLDLSRQICYALDHAHGKGIVHPELKPTNITLEWDGTAKLMDFGVPRKHPAAEISEASYYLSPEEVRGEPLTGRSNLFSWAAIAYQMASGKKPFDAPDVETLRRKIVEEAPVPPHEANPSLPPRVSEILLKALAKAPAERYASGAELLTDLENYKRVTAVPSAPVAVKTPTHLAAALAKSAAVVPAPRPAAPPPAAPAQRPAAAAAPAPAVQKPTPVAAAPKAQEPSIPVAKPPVPQPPAPPAAAGPAPKSAAPAPTPATGAQSSKNPLVYGLGGAVVLLVGIVVGLWMRSSPAQPPASSPVAATPAGGTAASAAPGGAMPAENLTVGSSRSARAKQPAAAPAPAPVATGGLALDSSPQGAEVQIDGRHEANWVTPFTATGLAAGGHAVSFSKAGHMSVVRSAQVTAGQNAIVAVQLTEMAATVSVSSNPAGAAILVDGKDSGKVTPAQVVVAKGSHTIAVRKAGYLEETKTLDAAPGQAAQFSPALRATGNTENIKTVGKLGGIFGGGQENAGRVSVKTNPKGAQVAVNGRALNKTTPVDFYLEPGNYEISVTMGGYKTVKKVVEVKKGGKLTVDETLAR